MRSRATGAGDAACPYFGSENGPSICAAACGPWDALTGAARQWLRCAAGTEQAGFRIRLHRSLPLPVCTAGAAPGLNRDALRRAMEETPCPTVVLREGSAVIPFSGVDLTESGLVAFALHPAFLDACVSLLARELPPVQGVPEEAGANLLYRLSRHGGTGCPEEAPFVRLLLLLLASGREPGALKKAEALCPALLQNVPPKAQRELLARSGAYGEAAGRLYALRQREANPRK